MRTLYAALDQLLIYEKKYRKKELKTKEEKKQFDSDMELEDIHERLLEMEDIVYSDSSRGDIVAIRFAAKLVGMIIRSEIDGEVNINANSYIPI